MDWLGQVDSWGDLLTVAGWYPAEAALMVSVLLAVAGILLLGAGFTGILLWRRVDDERQIAPGEPALVEAGAE